MATSFLTDGYDAIADCLGDGVTACAENTFDSIIDTVEDIIEPVEDWWDAVKDSPLGDAIELIGTGFSTLFTDTGCEAAGGTMVGSGISVPTDFSFDWDDFKLTVEWQELEYCELGVSEFLGVVWSYNIVDGIASGCDGVATLFGADDSICSDVVDEVSDFASSISTSNMRLSFGSCSSDWSMGLGLTAGTSITVSVKGVEVSVSGGAEVGLLWGCDGETSKWAIEPFWAVGGGLGLSVGKDFEIAWPSIGLSFHHRDHAYGDFYGIGTELTLEWAMLSGAIAMSQPAFDWCEKDVTFGPVLGVSWTLEDIPFAGTDNFAMTKHPVERSSSEYDHDAGEPLQCSLMDWYISGYDVGLDLCDLPDLFTQGLACIIPDPTDFQDMPTIGFGVGYASNFAGASAAQLTDTDDTGFHVTRQGNGGASNWGDEKLATCQADSDTTSPVSNSYGNDIGVRCCDSMGSTTGGSDEGWDCTSAKTYDAAEELCEDQGMVLCSLEQIDALATKGTGCSFDAYAVWTRDGCSEGSDPSAAAHYTRQGNGGAENYGDEKFATCQYDSDTTSPVSNSYGNDIGVRCCDSETSTTGGSDEGWDCTSAVSYDAAEQLCTEEGMVLCSVEQIDALAVKGTGCSFDWYAVWTRDDCTKFD
eukprot:g458.t1